jgi:hypothetical protein
VPTFIERTPAPPNWFGHFSIFFVGLVTTLPGCGGEPSEREVKNAQAFEALLTAVSLKNPHELESDAKLIDERHAAGDLSDENHNQLAEIINKARAKDWHAAQTQAYQFRAQFGDRGSFFK